MLEEEEGSRWLRRTETLDSRLWERLEIEEAAPGLLRERREEDRPSPNRGDKGKKGERWREKEGGKEDGGGERDKGWSRQEKHMK